MLYFKTETKGLYEANEPSKRPVRLLGVKMFTKECRTYGPKSNLGLLTVSTYNYDIANDIEVSIF